MFRSVIVNQGELIKVKDNWLLVTGESENKIPIEDIYSVVIDNRAALLSMPAITALTDSGVHILLCNEKHMPVSVVLPLNTHYRPLDVIERQLALGQETKDLIWKKIIRKKIYNQAVVLQKAGVHRKTIGLLKEYIDGVSAGDITNREGLAAKVYFRALFGSAFIRMQDDAINSALNYGYAILRSAVSKSLASYGFNCVLGVHHINKNNPFNLADDLMEPLRPVIDYWADRNHESLLNELTKENRREIINIMKDKIEWDQKKTAIRFAIDRYIGSFSAAVQKMDYKLLKIPIISQLKYQCGDTGDEQSVYEDFSIV